MFTKKEANFCDHYQINSEITCFPKVSLGFKKKGLCK